MLVGHSLNSRCNGYDARAFIMKQVASHEAEIEESMLTVSELCRLDRH
jgi:hypothetical protein